MSEDKASPHEVVIVRRRGGGHDDGHHGGAWKIAFADFMTALMCFFLVMWLINSTDKKTVSQVASYFNPLKLNDKQPSKKGIHDPEQPEEKEKEPAKEKNNPPKEEKNEKNKDKDKAKQKEKEKEKEKDKDKEKKEKKDKKEAKGGNGQGKAGGTAEADGTGGDQELLRDPYGTLDRIAKSDPGFEGHRMGPDPRKVAGLPMDTFDPAARRVRAPEETMKAAGPDNTGSETHAGGPPQIEERHKRTDGPGGEDTKTPADVQKPPTGGNAKAASKDSPKDTAKEAIQAAAKDIAADGAKQSTAGAEIQRQIAAALADIKPGSKPDVEVIEQNNALLISITDEFDFGMFAVGSASPTPELVRVMDRIAKVVSGTDGKITLRGHTDGRQYRTADKDNWRLSMARAQMAFYMLVRGGIPEKRIQALEGHADQALKVPGDALAARNRRIEILISKET